MDRHGSGARLEGLGGVWVGKIGEPGRIVGTDEVLQRTLWTIQVSGLNERADSTTAGDQVD